MVRLKQEGLLSAARLKKAQENEMQRVADINAVENDISKRKKDAQEIVNAKNSVFKIETTNIVKPKKEVGDAVRKRYST